MGFFSWDCKVCGHSLLSPYSTNHLNDWMANVVVIEEDGSILVGEYDGYGRVNGNDIGSNAPQCYHRKCWELAGRPSQYTEASAGALDQGYFFDDEHDVPEPKTFKEAIASRPTRRVSSIEKVFGIKPS